MASQGDSHNGTMDYESEDYPLDLSTHLSIDENIIHEQSVNLECLADRKKRKLCYSNSEGEDLLYTKNIYDNIIDKFSHKSDNTYQNTSSSSNEFLLNCGWDYCSENKLIIENMYSNFPNEQNNEISISTDTMQNDISIHPDSTHPSFKRSLSYLPDVPTLTDLKITFVKNNQISKKIDNSDNIHQNTNGKFTHLILENELRTHKFIANHKSKFLKSGKTNPIFKSHVSYYISKYTDPIYLKLHTVSGIPCKVTFGRKKFKWRQD